MHSSFDHAGNVQTIVYVLRLAYSNASCCTYSPSQIEIKIELVLKL